MPLGQHGGWGQGRLRGKSWGGGLPKPVRLNRTRRTLSILQVCFMEGRRKIKAALGKGASGSNVQTVLFQLVPWTLGLNLTCSRTWLPHVSTHKASPLCFFQSPGERNDTSTFPRLRHANRGGEVEKRKELVPPGLRQDHLVGEAAKVKQLESGDDRDRVGDWIVHATRGL